MSEEDDELFEITDFTNATPWESFISSIEKLLHQWGLTSSTYSADSAYVSQHWKSERVSYVGHHFIVTLHVPGEKKSPPPKRSSQNWSNAMIHMMDSSNDFPPKAHHISRWFGIHQFILITPDDKSEAITTEAQVKLLLSTISLAITNTGCNVPILVQIQKKWRHLYIGQCEGHGLRTTFQMIHMNRVPNQFNHLTGLLELFRSKLHGSLKDAPPINVAARFTYTLRHWDISDWQVDSPGEGPLTKDTLNDLPIGATSDPIQELHLSATWPYLTEEIIVDNATNSGFDPFIAPTWNIKTHLLDNPGLLMIERLNLFLKICYRHDTFTSLIGNKLLHEDIYTPGVGSSDFSHALTKLTSPASISSPISLSSVMYSTSQRLELGSEFEPISEQEQDAVLDYLFPDTAAGNGKYHKKAKSFKYTDDDLTRQLKSAPPDSFTIRLARSLCIINYEYGLKALAHIWYEVIQELRYRWENGIILSEFGEEPPDMLCCLLHQKFQMLNSCIRHKVRHSQRLHSSFVTPKDEHNPTSSLSYSQRVSSQPTMATSDGDGDGDSDDEFYEAQEELDSDQETESLKNGNESVNTANVPNLTAKDMNMEETFDDPLSSMSNEEEVQFPSSPHKTETLGQYKDLLLLATGEPLQIPETQEGTPLTEDMLWEQQDVLSKLGTTQEAAQVRAKMQSMSLISDMQSFKAANPGSLLEDFVRWYSPRDWIEGDADEFEDEMISTTPTDGWELDEENPIVTEDTKYRKGHLSLRMRQPGNMWVESWENAPPIPAYKQKRLFDDTKEAEKVLHFLSNLKPFELVLMLLPCLFHSAILSLRKKLADTVSLPSASGYLQDAISIASTVQRVTLDSLPIYQECIGLIEKAEHDISTACSLQLKLKQGLEFMGKAGKGSDVELKELMISVQMLLEGPELVLQDPMTSVTGLSFKGLLSAQLALQNFEYKGGTHSSHQVISERLLRPTAREFILRLVIPQPSPLSSSSPQRMFCLLTKDEIRIAGSFTNDFIVTS